METNTIYHLEPTITEKGPINIIGTEDLFVGDSQYGQIGMDGKTKTP
jgi:hypothetical protein